MRRRRRLQFRPFCGKRIADAVDAPPPPPPLGICGSIAAAAGRILGLVLLTAALAGAFAVGLQPESAKPQNFAFANLLAAPAFAQSGIPNPDFPPPAVQATANPLDTGDFQIKCEGVDGQLKSTHGAQDTLPRGDFCDGLSINHNGEEYSGCYVAYEIPFVSSSIHAIFAPLGENLPDCRNVIPFCPDSRKAPDLRGDTDNPFSACQACADLNRVDGNPECGNCLTGFTEIEGGICQATSGIPNTDFPDPETISTSDTTALGADCSGAGGNQGDAQDRTSGEFGLWCDLDIRYDGVDHEGCYYQHHSDFDRNNLFDTGTQSEIAAGLPDCRNVIPFCADSRKTIAGNPFSACRACADFNRVNGYPECGTCLANFAENDEGLCRALQNCAAQNRFQPDAFTCGDCLLDFTEDAGLCKENKTCANENRVQTNAFTCGACVSGYTEGAGSCQADKNCAAEDRVQTNAYTCGDCLPGFAEGAESCQVIQFCAGQGRIQTNAYTCGECLPDHGKINEHCVHPENPLPEDRTTCAEVFGGDWVDLSAAHGAGKGVCSGIDINDTFCLAGTGSALPCLGLFNHVRSCNLLGRPALDPWHCAAACAGGKAAGARCLE